MCTKFKVHNVTSSFPENTLPASPTDSKGQWYVFRVIKQIFLLFVKNIVNGKQISNL